MPRWPKEVDSIASNQPGISGTRPYNQIEELIKSNQELMNKIDEQEKELLKLYRQINAYENKY